ncbi:MAG: LLM class F420-dependent oxidoreductase [Proteobacteria bacterium]|nr:LLM class F420-dependent oxidoreductase [Pseudomonadota bacterium]
MKFWQVVSFSEPEQLVDIARIVEEVGFDGILVSDHLFFPGKLESKYPYSEDGTPGFTGETPFPEPWAAISAMAAVTSRIRFGTMVYVLPLRNPLEVAKAAGTAAVLSGGRVVLGAGAGWIREEFDTLGVDFRTRGRRFDECIEALRLLWRGEMVEHHGRFFSFGPLQMSPAPAAPLPIYIGGLSEPALRRAATLGDGWIGAGQTPEDALATVARIRELRREAGRDREPFDAVAPLLTPPEPDVLKRLEEQGVTSTTSYPFSYTVGPTSTLEQKRGYLEQYAESVIARVR